MKNFTFLSVFSAVVLTMALIIASCTKEGPAGPQGAQGPKGEDGINGTDGTAGCITCHDNSELVEAKILQWGNSKHAIGGTFFENATTPCHTSQGFKEVLVTGAHVTAEEVQNPSNINCYTCHKIHDTYTDGDWTLRKTDPVTFWWNGEEHDFGMANLCAQCHQSRPQATFPDVNDPEGIFTVTSTRFGPHHGPQSELLTGTGVYLVGGDYLNNMHATIENACITCHMSKAVGNLTGGHTCNINDEAEGLNVSGCTACHTEEEAVANIEELQPEIQGLLDTLQTLLTVAGIYNPTTEEAVKGDYPNKIAGAFFNYMFIKEDKSLGVHNPKFAKTLLENSITSISSN
jgi:hypothetical protein